MSSLSGPFKIKMALLHPQVAFVELTKVDVSVSTVLIKYTIWLLILPPIFLWIGGYYFGWNVGADSPIKLSVQDLFLASTGYFFALVFGFASTILVSRWMATTYDAKTNLSLHVALITIVGAPLAIASAIHLLPFIIINLLVFIPALMWSMYLLYAGLPTVLDTTPEKGMLMASSLVGWLLVAAVSLLGIVLGLWAMGIGPSLGV